MITKHQTYFFTPRLGYGKEANVFAISPAHAVKVTHVLYDRDETVERFQPVLERHRLFYSKNISVPKSEGIEDVKIRHKVTRFGFDHGSRVGLVMQRLYGVVGLNVDSSLKERVEDLYEVEADKAWELGYFSEEGLFNSIYVPLEDKLFLVDLREWRQISECSSLVFENHRLFRQEQKERRNRERLSK